MQQLTKRPRRWSSTSKEGHRRYLLSSERFRTVCCFCCCFGCPPLTVKNQDVVLVLAETQPNRCCRLLPPEGGSQNVVPFQQSAEAGRSITVTRVVWMERTRKEIWDQVSSPAVMLSMQLPKELRGAWMASTPQLSRGRPIGLETE